MKRMKSTSERGKFKQEIHAALYKSEDIKELLFDGISGVNEKNAKSVFKDHVKSHLFIDDTVENTESYIFYDIVMPNLDPQIKDCRVVLYAICHRDILDTYTISKEGYYGNRADILSQMIEDCLINNEEVANSFGIGKLSLDSVDIYNSKRFYGCFMQFSVPNFRHSIR